MKKVLSVLVVIVFIAGMAFAASEADTTVPASGKTAASKAPVASAAAEVTKETADVATAGIERRQTRRETRRETLFGTGEDKKETPATKDAPAAKDAKKF